MKLTFQKGKTYLVWYTESIAWTLYGERSNDLQELKCLEVSKTGSIKFRNRITNHTFWVQKDHDYKIKEQL